MAGTSDDKAKASKGPIVVKKIQMAKRKKRISKPQTAAVRTLGVVKQKAPGAKASFGLPTFRLQVKPLDINGKSTQNTNPHDAFGLEGAKEQDLPSDTLVAIHSLIQSDRGLHVPITNNGSVQVILESQVYSTFDEDHASNVNAELLELINTNKLKRMNCQNMSTMAFILTEDYKKAVWDSQHNTDHQTSSSLDPAVGKTIVTWFVAELDHWTTHSISESSIEDRWETYHERRNDDATNLEARDVVLHLLNARFLIREQNKNNSGNQEDSYVLWLPNWGIVLKTWNEARKQLLTLLAQQKEMSKTNVLRKNRHSRISTAFLIDELLSTEKIRVVERPFGSFVQLVKEDL